jgi:membrane associated rhomboid family serine protease
METGRFMEYMNASNRAEEIALPDGMKKDDPEAVAALYVKMRNDDAFMKRLRNDEIITPKDEIYAGWKELSSRYDRMQSEIVSEKYGYKPAERSPMTAFSYMFLHGSTSHLLGNMLFLWLVGCTLELAGRRWAYGIIYLVTGVISAVGFGLIYRDSMTPLVGASGAISGIIGAYTVLYGMKKVKIFYSVGFYFDYVKVAAIFLLPVWIGNELFQLYFGGVSNVAYVGHIGGLVSGAGLGLVQKKVLGDIKETDTTEERAEKIASLLESGLQKFSKLDLEGARALMSQVLEMDPDNQKALVHLFNIEKMSPEGEEFHAAAARLLLSLHRDPQLHGTLVVTYQEYRSVVKHPKLSPDIWSRVCSVLSREGRIDEAEKIVAMLLRSCPQYQAIPTSLLNLARAYLQAGMEEKGTKCLRVLCERYPQSPESRIAQGLAKATA